MSSWIKVEAFPNYEVSECGKVRSIDRTVLMKNGRKRFHKGIELQPVTNSKGYVVVTLHANGEQTTCRIHRLVAEAFVEGRSETKNQVNHIDGNKQNNHKSNLEWCDQNHNNQHGYDTGLIVQLKNEDHPLASLTNKQVREIKRLLSETKMLQREIAELFGVARTTISRINTGITYKDV